MGMFDKRLGVDLGTVNVLIYENDQIVLQEPALVALTVDDERIVEIGQPAREMLGRVDEEDIQVIRPLAKRRDRGLRSDRGDAAPLFQQSGGAGALFQANGDDLRALWRDECREARGS